MDQNIKLIVYGDPHGEYEPLIEACRAEMPDCVMILGDMTEDFKKTGSVTPIKESLAEITRAGTQVLWIPGNHDTDTAETYDATFNSLPDANIHGKVVNIADSGLRVAGLGGVFRGKVWFPQHDFEDPARFESPEELLRYTPKQEYWRGGLPLRQRTSIFRSQARNITDTGANILISHEAPSCMDPNGFMALDQIANDAGVSVIFHGHHHTSYEDELMNGIRVRGVGMREVVRINI